MYSIKDLELLSGIKAHTIRMWEKRYELLEPDRTQTNIRKYDERQLIKLLNVSTLVQNNWKISKVSQLNEAQLKHEVERLIFTSKISHDSQVNEMMRATLEYDELSFVEILDFAQIHNGLQSMILDLIFPFLQRVGLFWRLEELSPAHEHFASSLLRQRLLSVIDSLPSIRNNVNPVLLYLPEGEYHEMGLIAANYLLRSMGTPTLYLGASVPLSNMIPTIQQVKPRALVTLVLSPLSESQQIAYFQRLTDAVPKVPVYVGTSNDKEDSIWSNVHFLNSLVDLQNIFRDKGGRSSDW